MNTSDTIAALATALASAQTEMTNAAYNKVNPAFKSKYADLAAIREASLPALNKHGLSIWQGTTVGDHGLVLVTRLFHKSGEWIESTYPIPLNDKPQIMGSALTYARRYAWSSACGITSEEDDDANEASKPNGHAKPAPTGELLTSAQLATMRAAIREVGADEDAFCTWLHVARLEDLAAERYQPAMAALARKKSAA